MNDQGNDGAADAPPQTGSGGTTRVQAPANTGPAGTTRVAPPTNVGPAGTTRVSNAPADAVVHGPGGTTRVGASSPPPAPADVGQFGTTRVGAQPPGNAHALPAVSSALHYAPGNMVQLNGIDYQVLGELTSNSSEAITYRVQRGATVLVLKQYHPGIRMPRDVLERVRNSPNRNVVRVEDFGSVDGQDVEVLAFITGGTLDQLLRRTGPIHDVARLKLLAQGLLDGLHHLHTAVRIIYQDLKPENVLIADDSLRQVVLADFGISSVLKPGQSEATVVANGTKEYAAPELARFGNQTDASVDAKVDYFAFGVTLLECWLGKRPFEGVPDAARLRQVRDMALPIPLDIDAQLGKLIAGLMKPLPNDRWDRDEITRWIEGKPLTGSTESEQRKYEVLWFNNQESFSTPVELATLLAKYPDKGMDYLFLGKIEEWLNKAGDMELSTEVLKITRGFDKDPKHRRAGLTRAVYALDPGRPFVTAGGRTCLTGEDLGDAFWIEKDHYIKALKDPLDDFHLYLQATGEGENSAQILQHHLVTASETLAFNSTVYTLQGGGRNRIKLGDKYFFTPDEINADPGAHVAMRAELATEHSRGLVWLTKLGFITGTAPLATATAVDAIELLKLFPWLDVKADAPALTKRQTQIATELIGGNRLDLLDVYRQRGLRFDNPDGGQFPPLSYAAATGNLAAAQFLVEHGAPIDLQDTHGATSLLAAVCRRYEQIALYLLEKGADPGKGDSSGLNPLGAACSKMKVGNQTLPVAASLVEPLLLNGAKPGTPDGDGELPLHRALRDSDTPATALQILEDMKEAGFSVNQAGKNTLRPGDPDVNALFAALFAYKYSFHQSTAYLPVIQRIIALGASPDQLYDGKRPLHFAALWNDENLAKALRAARADPALKSADGMLPAAVAHANGSKAVAAALSPGKSYIFRSRMLIAAGSMVRGLAVLTLLIAAILATNAFLGMAWQGTRVSATPELLTVFGLLLAAIVICIRMTLAPGTPSLLPRLRTVFGSVKSCIYTLVVLPPVLFAFSIVGTRGMAAVPWTAMFRTSPSASLSWAIGAGVLGLLATTGALIYSARSAAARTALIGIGAKGSTAAPPNPALRRLTRFVVWWLKAGAVVGCIVFGYNMLSGKFDSFALVNPFIAASSDPCVSFTIPLAMESTEGFRQRKQQCLIQMQFVAATDACGVASFLSGGNGPIQPNARLKGTEGTTRWSVRGASTGVERRNLPVSGPIAICTLPTAKDNGGVFYVIADRAFNAALRKAGERAPTVAHTWPPDSAMPYQTGTAPTVEAVRDAPEAPESGFAKSNPEPAPAQEPVSGLLQGFSPEGWPLVNGQTMRLAGLENLAEDLLPRFQAWVRTNGDKLECTAAEGGYTCLTPRPARADIGLMAVINGLATVSATAPLTYHSAMEDARKAQRGRWRTAAGENTQ